MIKVFLRRQVRPDNYDSLMALLTDLRAFAIHQPGYLTGETLIRGKDPIEILSIGTWLSEDHWVAWSTAQHRHEIMDMVNPLLEGETEATIYSIPTGEA